MPLKPQAKQPALALMGGTFDPIHWGHIHSAQFIAEQLSLNSVTLMPCKIPVHKQQAQTSEQHRCAMLQAVCQQFTLFELDDRELTRTSASYTLTSLQEIKQQQPERPLYFLIGMDSLISFTSWHQWQQILQLCHLVVCVRPNSHLTAVSAELQPLITQNKTKLLTQASGLIYLADNPHHDISSTHVRQALSAQQTIEDLVPNIIAEYIHHHQLYQQLR